MSLMIAPTQDIALCRQLRRVVFIEEQGVSEADEIDDQDDIATHLLAHWQGAPVSCQPFGSSHLALPMSTPSC